MMVKIINFWCSSFLLNGNYHFQVLKTTWWHKNVLGNGPTPPRLVLLGALFEKKSSSILSHYNMLAAIQPSAIIWHFVNMLTVATKENFKRNELHHEKTNELFRQKYIVTNVLHNSANGIIYEGVKKDNFSRVCFKQVAKQSVPEVVSFEGQTMPVEFYNHKLCSHLNGVVKVWQN